MIRNPLRICIISHNITLANIIALFWTNVFARRRSLQFLFNSDEKYFQGLISILRNETFNHPIQLIFRIFNTKNRIEMYTIDLENLFKFPFLKKTNSVVLIIDKNLQDSDLSAFLHNIIRFFGRRSLLKVKIRKPLIIILINKELSSEHLYTIRRKTQRYSIYSYSDIDLRKDFIELIKRRDDTNTLKEPLKWLLLTTKGHQFISQYI